MNWTLSTQTRVYRQPSGSMETFTVDSVKESSAAMLIPCLWTTLPWIVLGQTYYMSFIFNNYGYGVKPSVIEAPDLGLPGIKKPPKRVEDTLELSSMEQSRKSGEHPRPMVDVDSDSKTADTPETAKEITTESFKSTGIGEGREETSSKAPDRDTTESNDWGTLPIGEGTTQPMDTATSKAWEATWPPVTPHSPEFFEYPEAVCHEEMDLHEVFGIRLERDRGLATKILCQFKNNWGGPWLLMTRVELPVRIHMRHWFLGYVTEDYKDLNINFLALAHIMNNMRTAMLIIGQDANDQLVYNLYDDVVISSFNDVFMMRKAELVEANATDMLFLAVGKTLSSYAGMNRSYPLQVLGSWWGNTVKQKDMNKGYSCVFPRERNVTQPGYMAIFIKPSMFRNNNTAFYNTMITTRRPWGVTVDPDLMKEVKNNKTEYEIHLNQKFRRSKQIVQQELERRAKIFDSIEKVRNGME
ncbi:uncharacterized protein LOC110183143 [Drosophila serrata]|uniref:uncharacterized protein LOC110183143 n=1 Tax=Drosophila serrata TaxID=7274 RepID=UPI000A1D36C2|nr:uncharacterized protein LOC110183143 [Drosophila serrata]